jgi:hypothetical protein
LCVVENGQSPGAAGRGATRRSATSSTTNEMQFPDSASDGSLDSTSDDQLSPTFDIASGQFRSSTLAT